LSILAFVCWAIGANSWSNFLFRKVSPMSISAGISPMFSYGSFKDLPFRLLIHFVLIFVQGKR
jgi:hypothetical protein